MKATQLRYTGLPLDADTLRAVVPSVYAATPWEKCSARYSMINTGEVLNALKGEGFEVYQAMQSGTRIESKAGHTKHLLRLRHADYLTPMVGQSIPELILVNDSARGTSWKCDAGLWRMVCSNGMVVQLASFAHFQFTHLNLTLESVVNAALDVARQFPVIVNRVHTLQSIQTTDLDRFRFAERAMALRFPDVEKRPFAPENLLLSRRYADGGSDLFTVLNRVQENLLKSFHVSSRIGRSTRAVKSIDVQMQLNAGLWALAEEFAAVE